MPVPNVKGAPRLPRSHWVPGTDVDELRLSDFKTMADAWESEARRRWTLYGTIASPRPSHTVQAAFERL